MGTLCVRNEYNEEIDWCFLYKFNNCFNYFYYDQDTGGIRSRHALDEPAGAMYNTLIQLYRHDPNVGRIFYNDQEPGADYIDENADCDCTEDASLTYGHCKGVLGFNFADNTAFWILHSTPHWPETDNPIMKLLPGETIETTEKIYAQTYLCITLKDCATAEQIAGLMLKCHEPYVYDSQNMPSQYASQYPNLYALPKNQHIPKEKYATSIKFSSLAGNPFYCYARNRWWGQDPEKYFWLDQLMPELQQNLYIETWRHGCDVPPTQREGESYTISDVQGIDMSRIIPGAPPSWKATQDHGKWAICDENPVVMVGDINRCKTQSKRGGGAICFPETKLWGLLRKVI